MIADASTTTELFGDLEDALDNAGNENGRRSSSCSMRSSMLFEGNLLFVKVDNAK